MPNRDDRIVVLDVWLALQMTTAILVLTGGVAFVAYAFVRTGFPTVKIALCVAVPIILALRVFHAYSQGITIEPAANRISWPASDMEGGLLDILTLKRLWGHFFRESVRLDEIFDLRNDTVRMNKVVRHRLNVSGAFGSRQLEFSSKQKRDECRVCIQRAARFVTQGDRNEEYL